REARGQVSSKDEEHWRGEEKTRRSGGGHWAGPRVRHQPARQRHRSKLRIPKVAGQNLSGHCQKEAQRRVRKSKGQSAPNGKARAVKKRRRAVDIWKGNRIRILAV